MPVVAKLLPESLQKKSETGENARNNGYDMTKCGRQSRIYVTTQNDVPAYRIHTGGRKFYDARQCYSPISSYTHTLTKNVMITCLFCGRSTVVNLVLPQLRTLKVEQSVPVQFLALTSQNYKQWGIIRFSNLYECDGLSEAIVFIQIVSRVMVRWRCIVVIPQW